MVSTIVLTVDKLCETAVAAGEASMIASPEFATNALGLIGAQRLLERYAGETDAGHKARVRNAWVDRPQAGTRIGMIGQLKAAGFIATVKENQNERRADVQPADEQWNWDGQLDNWSRFWVVVTGHPGSSGLGRPSAGPELGQSGATWGSTATLAEIRALRAIVRKWKPAHAVCANIIVVINEAAWLADQPDGTWGQAVNRNRAAMYVPG